MSRYSMGAAPTNMSIAVVMYRNPLDEWLWESGVMWYLLIGCAVGFVAAIILYLVAHFKK